MQHSISLNRCFILWLLSITQVVIKDYQVVSLYNIHVVLKVLYSNCQIILLFKFKCKEKYSFIFCKTWFLIWKRLGYSCSLYDCKGLINVFTCVSMNNFRYIKKLYWYKLSYCKLIYLIFLNIKIQTYEDQPLLAILLCFDCIF